MREKQRMKKVRWHILFSGTVQGVGFRYRAAYMAGSLGLTGWVKNLWDGRVEMAVQGDQSSVEQMIARLKCLQFVEITDVSINPLQLEENERKFQIFY